MSEKEEVKERKKKKYFKEKIELKSVKVKREAYLGLGQTSQE